MHEDPRARTDASALAQEVLGTMEMTPTKEPGKEVANADPVRTACCTTVAAFQCSTEGRRVQRRVNQAAKQLAEVADLAQAESVYSGKEGNAIDKLKRLHPRPGCWVKARQNMSLEGAPGADR